MLYILLVNLALTFICCYQHKQHEMTPDTVLAQNFTHNKCDIARKTLSPLLIFRQITCPNIAAAYFIATYYIHLMNLTCIAKRADAVCVRRLIFQLAHRDLFFNILGTRLGSLNQTDSQSVSSLFCLQRPCQPAVDPFTFRRPVAFRHPLQRPLK